MKRFINFGLVFVIFVGGCQTLAQNSFKTIAQSAVSHVQSRRPSKPDPVKKYMISAANPWAAEAGLEMLRQGGSAIDAAIAAQMVLTLVEPQSSGIGGGGFLIHANGENGEVETYDGRETAPASAYENMFLDDQGFPRAFFDVVPGGTSVGIPGALRMLEMAHKDHGILPWADLFKPAIKLAEEGFAISERLHKMIALNKLLGKSSAAGAYFLDGAGKAKPVGSMLVNKPLAQTFRQIAKKGADVFYRGEIANDIIAAVNGAEKNPGAMTVADLGGYQAVKRDPVCLPYRAKLVCGMGPPSSGGIAVLQILGILQNFDLAKLKPVAGIPNVKAVHLIAEASRLAFADRNIYLADSDFIPVPSAGLLDPGYLDERAQEISLSKSMGKALPGMPGIAGLSPSTSHEGFSTTHLSVMDTKGNAVSFTSSIEYLFGSQLMVRGFMLNNQLTDFSFAPYGMNGPVANRVEPGKRPRSSMAPMVVLDEEGKVVLAVGSPGGPNIIGYVVKTLVAVLDWKMNIQDAIALPNFNNRNGSTNLEKNASLEELATALKAMGHDVRLKSLVSGLHGVSFINSNLVGGADPRREGIAKQ